MTHSIIFFQKLLNKLLKSLSKKRSMSLHIKNKVETESDYTLLYVDTGSDNFYCLVCPKSAETRIIEITDILNLPINH